MVHQLYFDTAATIITLILFGKFLENRSKRKAADAIKKVWAVVLSPDYQTPQLGEFETPDLSQYTQELLFDEDTDSYKGVYAISSTKTYDGNYSISVYAEDRNGYITSLSQIYKGDGDSSDVPVDDTPPITQNSSILELKAGWNLVSLPTVLSMNKSDLEDKFGFVISLWKYTDNKWLAYSPDDIINTKIEQNTNITKLETLNSGDGFWVNSISDINISFESKQSYTYELDDLNTGWNLIGSANEVDDLSIFDKYGLVWGYSNDQWNVYTDVGYLKMLLQDYNLVEKYPKNNAVWVYK